MLLLVRSLHYWHCSDCVGSWIRLVVDV